MNFFKKIGKFFVACGKFCIDKAKQLFRFLKSLPAHPAWIYVALLVSTAFTVVMIAVPQVSFGLLLIFAGVVIILNTIAFLKEIKGNKEDG